MTRSLPCRQRGASLLMAIFLITTIATLAAIGVQIGTAQRQTSNFAALGDRAFAAAQAGIEWGAYQALQANACPPPGPLTQTLNLTEGALNGFTVQVVCTPVQQADCAGPYNVYDISALAQWRTFGNPEYTSRQIRKRFAVAPC